jgi:hypothetical protein
MLHGDLINSNVQHKSHVISSSLPRSAALPLAEGLACLYDPDTRDMLAGDSSPARATQTGQVKG